MSTSRIAVLPPALADQIAAGEVVERAASVVKELCENSIDAGARRIDVDIDGGGRRSVRVVDDGGGMTPDEARLALRRHATSKIRSADDLWGLSTFGFRGEALPSIAAVSRLTLSTKIAGAASGFGLTVEAGVETDAREVGIPEGTQIEIRDLFFNTPARMKFQKTEATEAANVSEAVLRLALGHPEIHFRLRAAGRVVLDLPAHQKLGERVRAAFARRGAGALHEAWGEEGGHQVRAFLAAPDEATTTARSTFLFVGRRFIRDRSLLHALSLGYGDLLEKGRYPLAALFLDVPGEDLDVNVHPQKLEVRFARAAEVYAAVRHVVAEGVARAPWLPSARGSVRTHTLPPPGRGAADETPGGGGPPQAGTAQSFSAFGRTWRGRDENGDRAGGAVGRAADGPAFLGDPFEAPAATIGSGGTFFQSLAYIGQMRRTYLVCEAPGEGDLVLIDQHAAHERVVFEQLRKAHDRRETRRTRLLFPVPVDVGPNLPPIIASDVAALEELGFEVDPVVSVSAGSQVLLRAVPEVLKDADPKPLLRELFLQLAAKTGGAGEDISSRHIDEILMTMACHGAVRNGDVLGQSQALGLLGQLDGIDLHSHRPHGRPVLIRMALSDIERRFGRA